MSPFIERLGWVLIHSLWQLALLAAVAFVVQRMMQRTSAAARYAALLALLGLVVAAPLITWSVLPTPAVLPVAELPAPAPALAPVPAPKLEPPAPVLAPAPVTVGATVPITPVAPAPLEPILPVKVPEPLQLTWSQWAQQSITPWLSTIVWGWSLGVLAFAIRPLWSWFTVRQLRTQGVSPVSESVQAALAETARRLGVTQAVRVLQSTIVQVPIVAGYLKPVILLPASIVTGLPASQLEAILAHELAHIRRHDYLANLIQTLVETVFFYHPAVWWLSHQIRSERENCCDDIAVAMLGNRLDYSRALLAVEELRGAPTTLAVGASGGSLLGRVRRLFHRDVEPGSLSSGSMALGVVLVVGVLAIAAIAGNRNPSATKTEGIAFEGPVADETSWPQLGGSAAHNPISPVTNLPIQFHLDRKENIRWSQPIGDFAFSSPVVAEGKVLIGTNNAIGRDPRFPASIDRACLQCFDERTGEFLWQYSSPKMEQGRRHDWPSIGICSTPVIEGDRVWFATNRCEIVCLDLNGHRDNEDDGEPEASAPGDSDATAKTLTPNPSPGGRGEPENQRADVVWKYDMFNTLSVRPLNATCVTPVIAGDLLLLNSGNDVDESYMNVPAPEAPAFLAFHKTTGQLIWSDKTPNPNILGNGCSMGAPAVAKIDGVWQAIFAGYDGWLYAFDLESIQRGETLLLWKFDLNPKESQYQLNGPRNEFTYRGLPTTPVVVGDHVFAAVGHNPERGEGLGRLWCIDAAKRGDLSSDLVYNKAAPDVVIPHKRVQACEPDKGDFTRPNPNSGVEWVYTTDDLNKNGKIEFEEQMHLSNSLPAIHDGLLLTTDLSGLVHCLDVATGELLWTHDQLATCWSGPLLADGKAWVIDEDGDLSIFALSREKQLIAEIAMNSPGWTNFAAANQTLYLATKTQLVAIGSGEFPDPRRLAAELPDGIEIELAGITRNTAPAQEGWRPDGSPLSDVNGWKVHLVTQEGETTQSATENDPRADRDARDLLLRLRGLKDQRPSIFISEPSGFIRGGQWLPNDDPFDIRLPVGRLQGLHKPSRPSSPSVTEVMLGAWKSQPEDPHLTIGITVAPWGRPIKIRPDGVILNPIQPGDLYAETYQLVEVLSADTTNGSWIKIYQPPSKVDPANSLHAYDLEFYAIDTEGGRHTTGWRQEFPNKQYGLWVSYYGGDKEQFAGKTLSHYEYRVRPYRDWVTFSGLAMEPGKMTNAKVVTVSYDPLQSKAEQEPLVAKLPGGLEVELVGVTKNFSSAKEGWKPDGSPIGEVPDWKAGTVISRNGDSTTIGGKGTPHPDARDLLVEMRGLRLQPAFDLLDLQTAKGWSQIPHADPYRNRLSLLLKKPNDTLTFRMAMSDAPWGPYQQVGLDGKLLNEFELASPEAEHYSQIRVIRCGPHPDNSEQSELTLEMPEKYQERYSFAVHAIDTDGKEMFALSDITYDNSGKVTAKYRTDPGFPGKIARWEYRLRPYRHFIKFENVSFEPGRKTEPKVSVESIPEATATTSSLELRNPDNTPWQGSLVAGHIGFILPDAKAWNTGVGKDGQADLSALPAGKHWLISRFPWSVIPVETPLQQTVRQPLRLGTPPKKHSSSNYSGHLSVQRDERGREFIQCDFYNNTDELWSFSELDLTLEAGWFSTESHGHSPQWLGDTLTEVPQIEIPPGQKGSLRIDWPEWAKRGVWDPMSGPQNVSKPVLPDQEPGKIWVRISGPGFGTNPVAVKHPDKLLAVSDEPVPQPPAPDEVDGPRVNLVGLTWNRVPKNDAWEPNGNPMPVPDWAKTIIQLLSAEMSDIPVLLYEIHGLKGTPSINFHESSITTGDGELTGSVFRQALLRLRTRDEYRNVPPKVSISDEPWGPWRIITKSGEMAGPVPEDSPYRLGYAMVSAHGVRPLRRNAQVQGLILQHPKAFRDLYDFEIEEVWLSPTIGPSDIYQGDSAPVGEGENARVEIEHPLPSHDDLKEYRYRIRPYRHHFVFANVNYAPSQNPSNYTPFKTVYTKLEHDLPKPEAAIQQPEPQDRPRLHAKGEAEARAELERLAITDPGHIHATRRATANPNGWKWSVYLPPGKKWRLYCESGMIPKWQDIQPTAETTSYPIHRKDEQRIIELEAYVSPDTSDDGKLKLWVEADRSFLQGLDWVAWKIAPQVADYITGRTQKSSTIDHNLDIGGVNTLNAGRNQFRLILTHRRFGEANDKGNVEPEFMPGFCVWIQADPEVPKEPTVGQANPKAQIALVQNLSSHDQSIRDRAAAQLKSEFKPSAKEPWQAKVDSIPKNAPRAEVIAKLGIDEKRDLYGIDSMEQYRLDDTWMVRIWFTGDLQNLNTIELIEQLHRPWVDPPASFTGTWVTYYVNGEKAHEIEYLNGKYHGRHRSYHANGQLLVQQHYVDHVAHGEDTGYDASGNLSYRGLYENGKQVGPWIHYNEDGSERSRTEHPAPRKGEVSPPEPANPVAAPSVELQVVDAETGQPIAGAEVTVRQAISSWQPKRPDAATAKLNISIAVPESLSTLRASETGHFSFTTPPELRDWLSDLQLSIQHPDYVIEQSFGAFQVTPEMAADLSLLTKKVFPGGLIKLKRGHEISGLILGPDGQPAAGVKLYAAWQMPQYLDMPPHAVTDAQGRYKFRTVKETESDLIFVIPKDAVAVSFPLKSKYGEHPTIRLERGTIITGQVLGQDGKPLAGVVVQANGSDSVYDGFPKPMARVLTDFEGRYRLPPQKLPVDVRVSTLGWMGGWQPPGRSLTIDEVFIPVMVRDESQTVKTPGADASGSQSRTLDFRPCETVTLTAHVYDEKGQPATDCELAVYGTALDSLQDDDKLRSAWRGRFHAVADQPGLFRGKAPKGLVNATLVDPEIPTGLRQKWTRATSLEESIPGPRTEAGWGVLRNDDDSIIVGEPAKTALINTKTDTSGPEPDPARDSGEWGTAIEGLRSRLRLIRDPSQTPASRWKVGQPVFVALEIENVSEAEKQLSVSSVFSLDDVQITGPDGKPCPDVRGPLSVLERQITILPGETKAVIERADLNEQFLMTEPGEYRIRAKSPTVSKELSSGELRITLAEGEVSPIREVYRDVQSKAPAGSLLVLVQDQLWVFVSGQTKSTDLQGNPVVKIWHRIESVPAAELPQGAVELKVPYESEHWYAEIPAGATQQWKTVEQDLLNVCKGVTTKIASLSPQESSSEDTSQTRPLLVERLNRVIEKSEKRARQSIVTPYLAIKFMLAFGPDATFNDPETTPPTPIRVEDWLCGGPKHRRISVWQVTPHGVQTQPYRNLKDLYVFEGAYGSFLNAMAESGLPLTHSLKASSSDGEIEDHKIQDVLMQYQRTMPNRTEDFRFTEALLRYGQLQATWKDVYGEDRSTLDLLRSTLRTKPSDSINVESMRLTVLAIARNQHQQDKGSVGDPELWTQIEKHLQDAISNARRDQLPDGSWPTSKHSELSATSQMLKWIVEATPPAQLGDEWIFRAVESLITRITDRKSPVTSPHEFLDTIHALRVYRDKRFGASMKAELP